MHWINISFLLCYAAVVRGSPIDIEITSFEDNWNYKIAPDNEPVLLKVNNHTLPVFSKRELQEKFQSSFNENSKNSDSGPRDTVKKKFTCAVCKLGALLLQNEVQQGNNASVIREKFISICVGFNIENEIVCSGIFDVFAPDMLPVLKHIQIGPPQICSLIMGEGCGDVKNPLHQWDVIFPDIPKPALLSPSSYLNGGPILKVLHLSDSHYDPNYVEGSPSNCAEPMCCHSYSTMNGNEIVEPAGKWGSYGKCDTPKIFIQHMLKHIADTHKDIDYIIWTGDLPPHDIWNQTKQGNLDIVSECVQQMVDAFPDIPIFPALGNHEGVPQGSFAPPWVEDEDHSTTWLYSELSEQWATWLPSSVNSSVYHGAFYSVLVRPSFRIISLNMNYCIRMNWFLMLNSTDPAKELQWLIYELQEAENNGEKVHIIGHIPPGDSDCLKVWSQNYYKIVDRYESTIVAQFFSHTHNDEFEVFFDSIDHKRPTNVAYIGPSITTYENLNPGYRIYYVDGEHNETTWEVMDHETWVTNLEEANKENAEPEYYRLYTAKEVYNMETLRPQEWAKLIDTLAEDKDSFDLFYRFYYKDSPVRPDCDDICKGGIICDLRSGKSHSRKLLCPNLKI